MNTEKHIKAHSSCEIKRSGPCGYVIFGASGDLSVRKLLPAVFSLFEKKRVPGNFFVAGYSRTKMDDKAFRGIAEDAVYKAYPGASAEAVKDFVSRCYYVRGEYDSGEDYSKLKKTINELEKKYSTKGNMIFHIATPPFVYENILKGLSAAGLAEKENTGDSFFKRIIIEKPFGRDSSSAKHLDDVIEERFTEKQIYRIDHYLGKETVQNIITFRFANTIFEPIWTNECVDNIQITVFEQESVGHRTGYFEKSGLLRDMFQNHILQLAALVGMERPDDLSPDSIRDGKVKFMSSIKPIARGDKDIIRAQYGRGTGGPAGTKAYREEEGADPKSCTETFFALKFFVENKRWKGVPFYVRAGKAMDEKTTRITIVFKKALPCPVCAGDGEETSEPNALIFSIHPQQGVFIDFAAKIPGSKNCMAPVEMKFNYKDIFGSQMNEDYATLILDCMTGDQTLYWRRDGMEISWNLVTPVLEKWESCTYDKKAGMMSIYPAGSSGPPEADEFIKKDGRNWMTGYKKEQ
ncbi:MAG: glucose-6-phosphate dehydrogenase [Candidatus Goldiibacteriota bacterium]